MAKRFKKVPWLLSTRQFCDRYDFVSMNSLRWQIHRAEALGLQNVFKRFKNHRRVLVDVQAYFEALGYSLNEGADE